MAGLYFCRSRKPLVCMLLFWATLAAPVLAQETTLRGHKGWVGAVAFSPDGKLLASGAADKTVKLWRLAGKGESVTLTGHRDYVCAVAFSPKHPVLATGSYDHSVKLWDLKTNKEISTLEGHRGVVTSVAFSPDGKLLASGSVDGNVHIWDPATGNKLLTLDKHKSWVNGVAFAPDGTHLATGSSDNTVQIWVRKNDGWDLKTTIPVAEGEVRSVAFSPDSRIVATGLRYGAIRVWDTAGMPLAAIKGHQGDVWSVALSPDGKLLASGDGDWDRPGKVKLWDTSTWKQQQVLQHTGEVLSVAFAPGGKHLAAGSWDQSIKVWQLEAKARTAVPRGPLEFHIAFSPKVSTSPFRGRVFVMVSKPVIKDLPLKPKWFNPEPFFAQDVQAWEPGAKLVIGTDAAGFPQPLAKLPRGAYSVQAVMDFDRGEQNSVSAAGNGYSKPLRLDLDPATSGPVSLLIDQTYPERRFEESARVKLVDVESKLLSKFHGKPMRLRAGVVVPKSFTSNPERRYPVVYEVPGFGGNHFLAHTAAARNASDVAGVDMVYVVLDPGCRLGHHVFANSANNGPYGQALIEELIPYIETRFRGLGMLAARFVTGHSSGGWSSLWLQVTYPDFFGGVWSTAPDPVDFRDFQRVNIYAPKSNIFTDDAGMTRPLARKGGKVILYFKPFSNMETVLGHGGQLESFEAVFSPRGGDGKPRKLWDRATGAIDPEVARAWEAYDIRMTLQKNWHVLGAKLSGKLRIYMGAEDTFYLEGATLLLKQSLASLGSDAVVEIFPGRDHANLLNTALRQRIAAEMADQFKRTQAKHPR